MCFVGETCAGECKVKAISLSNATYIPAEMSMSNEEIF